MKERKRGQGMVYVKFALIIIAAALVGGVVGYGAAANEAFLPAVMEALDRFLVWVGPWWFAPVYLALILGTVFYLRGRALLPQAEEDDGAFQRADRQLSVGLVFTGAAVPGMLTAMGLAFAAAGEEPAWMLASAGLLVAAMVWALALQARIVSATKAICPEKRGNVFDTRFQKDWYNSCDEAERQQIGQCSYHAFRTTANALAAATVVLCLLAMFGAATPFSVLVVGALWLVQQLSYLLTSLKTQTGQF